MYTNDQRFSHCQDIDLIEISGEVIRITHAFKTGIAEVLYKIMSNNHAQKDIVVYRCTSCVPLPTFGRFISVLCLPSIRCARATIVFFVLFVFLGFLLCVFHRICSYTFFFLRFLLSPVHNHSFRSADNLCSFCFSFFTIVLAVTHF